MTDALRQLFRHDAASGILLVAAALLAILMANSPLAGFYNGFLSLPGTVQIGTFIIQKPLLLWVNDGLMALFFFLVGLEIKREIFEGHLASREQILLPGIAAVAGIAVPALIYVTFNYAEFSRGNTVAMQGWAIPAATDIAFALGIFSLFGKRLPLSLKLFLLSVAIFDDIGVIFIIALFYSQDLSTLSLAIAFAGLLGLLIANRSKVQQQSVYIVLGTVVWAAVLKSGVHATLAGFAVAWFIPLTVKKANGHSMLSEMEHGLHAWVMFLILPLFAFANAGVSLLNISMPDVLNPVTMGITMGLFVGKQVGIFGACWLAVKLGFAKLPAGSNWLQLYAVSLLCGIGFTMSLFVGTLAFEQQGVAYLNSVKIGVLAGSFLSALFGSFFIIKSQSSKKKKEQSYEKSTV